MAGIGFELRKLFREQGLINNVKAYAYSSLTTVGPMILCMFLIIALQRIMNNYSDSYIEWELYIATVSYCFVFSIICTSGISIVLTRYVADMIYEKKYDRLMSSFYGALVIMLPLCAIVAWIFIKEVDADISYKFAAYLFFMELIVIWLQGVFLSALKDYIRIVRGFIIGTSAALVSGWLLFLLTDLKATSAALFGIDIGFFIIAVLSFHHFEQKFPRANRHYLFSFVTYFKKFSSLFFAGCFVYSGVYLHNFVYWLGPDGVLVANRFLVMPYYDLPVFFAFLSVMPTLVTFVVFVETAFYEKFRTYYLHIINGGTIQDIRTAKKNMQNTLVKQISLLMEVQLMFTVMAIALGIKFLPKIGFTMAQLDLYNLLVLSYFLFITMFVLIHVLMYFDDRKGVVAIGGLFVLLNIVFSYWMMMLNYDGLGMFIASFISLGVVIARLLYVLRNIDYFTFCSQPLSQSKQTKGKSFFTKPGTVVSVILLMTLVLSACTETTTSSSNTANIKEVKNAPQLSTTTPSTKLVEDKRLYERDDNASLKTLYVTILPSSKEANSPLNWYGLNRLPSREDESKLGVIVQEGLSDGVGPKQGYFGYGTDQANATITIRGRTAWTLPQKSYRIKLNDEAGLWMDQSTLNLNKHMLDLTRIRNKLSFDLFETIPNMTSLRTQFVHMYVKDLSEGNSKAAFEDYGLYTHVEQPNKRFMKTHMLDPNGYLYKVTFFEYRRYPELIKSHDDPTYDKDAFQTILEIKGREEHDKLIRMLDDVNNMRLSIKDVMEKHFDLDNFLTWTASNILMDNMDTDANNFYLYSPLNSDKWYILPWDYDGGWELQRRKSSIRSFQNGISNYWDSVLHNRYFRNPEHVEQLKAKVKELSASINEEKISELIKQYEKTVEPFLYRDPDIRFLPNLNTQFQNELQVLRETPKRGMERFLADLENPKPFYQHDVVQEKGKTILSWGLSYDIQGDDIVYDVILARDPQLQNLVKTETNVKMNKLEVEGLKSGIYYWRVVARDSHGNEQGSFNYYLDVEDEVHSSIRELEVQ